MQKLSLTLLLSLFLCTCASAQNVTGDWFAMLDAMGTKLPLKISVQDAGGQLSGYFMSPSQTQARFNFTTISYDGSRLQFNLENMGADFSGVVDGKEIRGVYSQAQVDLPVTFYRYRPEGYPIEEGPITITARPQDPTNFPYTREAVTFDSREEGITLAGELTMPENGKPKAALVLISGTGPQDRNAYLGSQINHSPFLVLSDFLTRRGYAVLRYDERGVGESTGDFSQSDTDKLTEDARAAVQYLRGRKDLKRTPVGMLGHSEGGIIAPAVSALDESLDFTILLAAPAIPSDSLMLLQRRLVYEAQGMPPAVIARGESTVRAAYAYVKESKLLDQDQFIEGLFALFEREMDNLPEPLRKSIKDPRQFNEQYVRPFREPWFRHLLTIDPTENLERLTIPVLAINGTLDTQVPAEANLNAISIAMARNENKDATVLPLVGLNHLFQPAETGAPTEYGTIETTFDPTALDIIAAWLDERFK